MKNRVYDMECSECSDNFQDIHIWTSCDVCGGKLNIVMERPARTLR
ncbi:MAG: hypothetical protein ACLQG5_11945 [Methanobacterium sp.]|jgi:rRNA maturation endonuclease Nob1